MIFTDLELPPYTKAHTLKFTNLAVARDMEGIRLFIAKTVENFPKVIPALRSHIADNFPEYQKLIDTLIMLQ